MNSPNPGPATPAISYPRLVIRIGFAGGQTIDAADQTLGAKLHTVFQTIAQVLAEVAPNVSVPAEKLPASVAQFYSRTEPPLIRLITGLCQGGDALANRARQSFSKDDLGQNVKTELAAVVPFELTSYRNSRPPDFLAEFDAQANACSYILVLDAKYKPGDESEMEKYRRRRAYRAQSTLLLRQCDLLIAVTDPEMAGRPGGTLETLRAAMRFNLPTVFIHSGSAEKLQSSAKGSVTIIEPGDDPASVFSRLHTEQPDWETRLRDWVERLVADPDIDLRKPGVAGDYTPNLLSEFFAEASNPLPKPVEAIRAAPVQGLVGALLKLAIKFGQTSWAPESWKIFFLDSQFYHDTHSHFLKTSGMPLLTAKRLEERKPAYNKFCGEIIWDWFTAHCAPGYGPVGDKKLEPYSTWRGRSTALNYYYAGNYRGAFVLNYLLAPVAVILATLGLVFLAFEGIPGLELALIFLALVKLGILGCIFLNTILVNGRKWNDRAVDYRYLAERLRSMLYLARIGSFQPPAATPRRRANKVVRQSAVDWLFNAIVRSAQPPYRSKSFEWDGKTCSLRLFEPAPMDSLIKVRDEWVKDQALYHDKTSFINENIYLCLETWVQFLNLFVIGLVGLDLVLALLTWADYLPKGPWTPLLIFCAAVFPAIVASLNAVRIQSECRRLAQRSAILCDILWGKNPLPTMKSTWFQRLFPSAKKLAAPQPSTGESRWGVADSLVARIADETANPETDPGSWTPEVLSLTESVAEVFVQEVSEWSVLYAKEVPEP